MKPCFKAALVARLRRSLPTDDELEDASRLFTLLAEPTRLKVMYLLGQAPELCVCDVSNALEISVGMASHHLRKLRDVGLLKHRTDGKWVYYALRSRSALRLVERARAEVAA